MRDIRDQVDVSTTMSALKTVVVLGHDRARLLRIAVELGSPDSVIFITQSERTVSAVLEHEAVALVVVDPGCNEDRFVAFMQTRKEVPLIVLTGGNAAAGLSSRSEVHHSSNQPLPSSARAS